MTACATGALSGPTLRTIVAATSLVSREVACAWLASQLTMSLLSVAPSTLLSEGPTVTLPAPLTLSRRQDLR